MCCNGMLTLTRIQFGLKYGSSNNEILTKSNNEILTKHSSSAAEIIIKNDDRIAATHMILTLEPSQDDKELQGSHVHKQRA